MLVYLDTSSQPAQRTPGLKLVHHRANNHRRACMVTDRNLSMHRVVAMAVAHRMWGLAVCSFLAYSR